MQLSSLYNPMNYYELHSRVAKVNPLGKQPNAGRRLLFQMLSLISLIK